MLLQMGRLNQLDEAIIIEGKKENIVFRGQYHAGKDLHELCKNAEGEVGFKTI